MDYINQIILVLMLMFSYFLGAIPFGFLVTKYAGLGDIRAIGSGNIGATNVLRTGNKKLALLTLSLDIIKGYGAVKLASWMLQPSAEFAESILALTSLAVVLGHMFPIWLKFKGGKGVATTFGVFTAINPLLALILLIIWIGIAYAFRYSSLSALMTSALAPFIGWAVFDFSPTMFWCSVIMVTLVIWRHKPNIVRLLDGTESKIFEKKE